MVVLEDMGELAHNKMKTGHLPQGTHSIVLPSAAVLPGRGSPINDINTIHLSDQHHVTTVCVVFVFSCELPFCTTVYKPIAGVCSCILVCGLLL